MPNSLSLLGKGILHYLLPGSCLLCGGDSARQALCAPCQADLPRLPAKRCPRCSLPTTHGEHCGACLQHPPEFASVTAAFAYDFPADRVIQALKYGHQTILADDMATALVTALGSCSFDLIAPLPLHPVRLAERGFNQAAELARRVGRMTRRPVELDGLIREKQGATQASLPLKERLGNVRGAFAARRSYEGLNVLLIDDVMTTGATLGECSRVLRLHGAKAVHCAVIARALPR